MTAKMIFGYTFMTEDEASSLNTAIPAYIEKLLDNVKFDSYNKQYVVNITIQEVEEMS